MAKKCSLCPRKCGADRTKSHGFCGAGDKIKAAKAYLHRGEEPIISGDGNTRGSGTIFFSNCQLKCPFCQNYEISEGGFGAEISDSRLAEIMLELQNSGAYNINLVSPTPYVPQIINALDICGDKLKIPVVYNCGGYESVDTLRRLNGYIQIYMPDIKFYSGELSQRYLQAENYFEIAVAALREMINQVGKPQIDVHGIMKSGVIVRHLVMPSCYRDSVEVLRRLYDEFGSDSFILSLMSQYIPCNRAEKYPEINRRVTTFEYEKALETAENLGFSGFMQQRDSATDALVPKWDFEGIL
ncbi:MAG: radical SAM protein [Acutalibacteraceae bacterium]